MASININSTSNLLRYISEWDPRLKAHTKGGYIDGEIKIPHIYGKMKMIIQTYPAQESPVKDIHPCLLHAVRIGKGKRDAHLEPVPTYYHWKQEFSIEDGNVYILNKLSELDVEDDCITPRSVPVIDKVTEVRRRSIKLGGRKGQLNLILLQPKQQTRAKKFEATITKVLSDRLGTSNEEIIKEKEKYFQKKHMKNLKQIRLRVDFYDEYNQLCSSAISPQTVVDTRNKDIGFMDFYDACPLVSCEMGGRKIIMVSEYPLASDVFPKFQVHDETGRHRPEFDIYLTQPENKEHSIKRHSYTLIFLSPQQKYLKHIKDSSSNLFLKLLVERKGDGYISSKAFNFRYIKHAPYSCTFCFGNIDSDDLVHIDLGMSKPKPGQKKRTMHGPEGSFPIERERKCKDDMSVSQILKHLDIIQKVKTKERLAIGPTWEIKLKESINLLQKISNLFLKVRCCKVYDLGFKVKNNVQNYYYK